MESFGVAWGLLGCPWVVVSILGRFGGDFRDFPGNSRSTVSTILASFFVDFWSYFSVRFLDHFWNDFGAILGAKMDPKSLKNRSKIRSNFWLDF